MSQLLNSILKNAYTKNEALSRLRVLKEYVVGQLFGREKLPCNLEYTEEQSTWLATLGKDFYKSFNRSNVYQIFDDLESEIKNMEALVVYLPFEPSGETTAEIGQRVQRTFNRNLLTEIKVDPNLLGGAALVWKGVYKEYSLRKRIEENREQIARALKEEVHG